MAKTKKKRNDQAFPYPLQIINLHPGLPLYSRGLMEKALQTFDIFKHTNNPQQPVFVTPRWEAQGQVWHDRDHSIPYVQILGCDSIDCRRNKNGDSCLPNRLYRKVLELKNKEEMVEFSKKYKFLTIFPTAKDAENLSQQYAEAGILEIPVQECIFKQEQKSSMQSINTTAKQYETIQTINNKYLWEKITQFKDIVRMFLDGTLQEHKFLWINDQMENVSPMVTSYDGALWKWTAGKGMSKNMEEIIGIRHARPLHPVIGYRILGRFAYCCWEFLMDVERDGEMFVCKNCSTIQCKEKGENRIYCTKEESRECFLDRQNARKQRERLSKRKK